MEDLQRLLVNEHGLSVSVLPEKGRCLFTTQDFSPGEVILSEEPYVSVPDKISRESRCDECHTESRCDWCFTSSNIKKCSSCHLVWYCGTTCQKSDWKMHRLECKLLAKLDKNRIRSYTPVIRLMVKLYLRRKLQNEKVIPTTAMDNYNLVKELVSHITKVEETELVLYAEMANFVNVILQWPDLNFKEVTENFSKIAINAHTIYDIELQPLGTGLYPVLSIVNHSCVPNSSIFFEGRIATLRAMQQIPKGTELSISYRETEGSTLRRVTALKEQFFFTCSCPRCIKLGQYDDIKESAILEGYRCKNLKCDGFLLLDPESRGYKCQQCKLVRDLKEIFKITGEVKELSDKASAALSSFGHTKETLKKYLKVEKLQMTLCHSYSINLFRTRETISEILMLLQDWKQELAYCKILIPVCERIYPKVHPIRGMLYYTRGRLEWELGCAEEAVISLEQAVDILGITHGMNSPFVKDLIGKLEEARVEASYKLLSMDD
ncbi:histone-lysine N-methyltransferase ASHR1-like [Rutidosis leptorrhynchoides]|uniref:histone-lysine N-methyltransferase ASHR1-like n=1 Tax=Rutidosis leptorrhynchoides TaxID=125765 RepID=UPI003A9A1308